MTNLKNLIGNKFLNTKQCPEGLSHRIPPPPLKYGKPSGWGGGGGGGAKTHPPPPHKFRETVGLGGGGGGEGKNTSQQPNIYSFSPSGKTSLINLHLLLSKVSFFPPSNSNFYLITLDASFISSCNHYCCITFFNFRLYEYTWHANFDQLMFTECCLQHDKSFVE